MDIPGKLKAWSVDFMEADAPVFPNCSDQV